MGSRPTSSAGKPNGYLHIFVNASSLIAAESQERVHGRLVGGRELELVEVAGVDPAEILDAAAAGRLAGGNGRGIEREGDLVFGIDGGPLGEPQPDRSLYAEPLGQLARQGLL